MICSRCQRGKSNWSRWWTERAINSHHSISAVRRDLSQNHKLHTTGNSDGAQGQNRSGWFGIPTPSPATALGPAQGADMGIFSRGRPVLSVLHGANNFNMLAGNIQGRCMTALNHATLVNAKVSQAFPASMVWLNAQFPSKGSNPGVADG